ncbi:MAG TPA: penicillin-binding protein activator [Steroidobacteraceae bacterium]
MKSMTQLNLAGWSRALAGVLALALAACAAYPPVRPPPPAGVQPAPGPAARGDHARSAEQYETLAATRPPPARFELLLSAAREWLAAERPAEAGRVLASLQGAALTGAEGTERALLSAETALAAQHPQEAWQRIAALPEPTGASGAERFYSLKMRIAMAAARPVDSVLAEMAAERVLAGAERTALRTQLLALLRDAHERGVPLDPEASKDPTVRGWLELGAIATQARGASLTAEADAARWRAKYPNHPALEVLSQALPAPMVPNVVGARVALLLPLSGPAAAQAAVVRDGFLSAYYLLPAAARPELRVFDTDVLPGPQALAQAHVAGSTFIVGPLTREDVAAVANSGAQSVPVLALNFLPVGRPAPPGLYQFALSPEEEARQVARRLLADGHHRGIALIPRGDWGNRVNDAFTRELLAGGGSLIGAASYDPAGHDYGAELRSILRIDDSIARQQRLQSVLGGKLNFEPRRRADIEFVFIAAPTAVTARLIEPQLKFFYAGDIPSYALANAYEPDSTASNQDIDGLMYPDMPWMVSGDGNIDQVRDSIARAWDDRAAWRSRLFAFGYDACQLMLAMSARGRDPADAQVAGLTGALHFDADRRVLRELIWVQIRNGEPRRLAPAAPQ